MTPTWASMLIRRLLRSQLLEHLLGQKRMKHPGHWCKCCLGECHSFLLQLLFWAHTFSRREWEKGRDQGSGDYFMSETAYLKLWTSHFASLNCSVLIIKWEDWVRVQQKSGFLIGNPQKTWLWKQVHACVHLAQLLFWPDPCELSRAICVF